MVYGTLMTRQGARLSEFLLTNAAFEEAHAEVAPHMHDETCALPERLAAAWELASISGILARDLYAFIRRRRQCPQSLVGLLLILRAAEGDGAAMVVFRLLLSLCLLIFLRWGQLHSSEFFLLIVGQSYAWLRIEISISQTIRV